VLRSRWFRGITSKHRIAAGKRRLPTGKDFWATDDESPENMAPFVWNASLISMKTEIDQYSHGSRRLSPFDRKR
jgi:hypothetical protein